MDARHFDSLTRALTEAGTRRGLLGLLAKLPVLGGLFALVGDADETDAKGRRKRRTKAHKHGKGRDRGKRKVKDSPEDMRARITGSGRSGAATNSLSPAVRASTPT